MSSDNSYFTATPPQLMSDAVVSDLLISGSLTFGSSGSGSAIRSPVGSLLGLYGVPAVAQPTTGITPVVVAGTGSGTVLTTTTFGGWTLQAVVAALISEGILSSA
jgi:hypothetical protein